MQTRGSETPPPSGGGVSARAASEEWDIATVTAEFGVGADEQAARVADLLFASDEVLTVRVGGPGERSVYRVDVPRGHHDARSIAARPANHTAGQLDVDLSFVRIGISSDGLGDPEGSPPSTDAVPWASRRDRGKP